MAKAERIQNQKNENGLTANDLQLKRFIELQESVKAMTKELDAMKAELKHRGSFSTTNYVVSVKETTRRQPPALKALIEKFGPAVEALCSEVTYKSVTVSRKG